MAYSKKVVDKFENTLKNPEKFNVGRFDPKDGDCLLYTSDAADE